MIFTDPPYGIDYADVQGKHSKIAGDDDPTSLLAIFNNYTCPMFVCCNWRSMPAFLRAIGNVEFKACIVWDKTVRIQNLDKFAKQHEFVLYAGPYGGEKTIDVDVWQIPREVQDNHPTAKPTALARRAIKSISGVRVYEPFSGSGTTIIACEQLNRKCYAIEIEPRYIDVAVKRWEKLTGKQATLDGDGRTFAEITAERAA